jgi:hypothetical protein
MTRGAGPAPHGFRAVGAERDRKQQGVYQAQQVECITSVPNLSEQRTCALRRKSDRLFGVGIGGDEWDIIRPVIFART